MPVRVKENVTHLGGLSLYCIIKGQIQNAWFLIFFYRVFCVYREKEPYGVGIDFGSGGGW